MLSWYEGWRHTIHKSLLIGRTIFFVSIFTVGFIETLALHQPTISESAFHYPHTIKGHTRFFSDYEEQIYVVAKPLMVGSFFGTFVLLGVCGELEKWRKRRNVQDALVRYAQRIEERELDSGSDSNGIKH